MGGSNNNQWNPKDIVKAPEAKELSESSILAQEIFKEREKRKKGRGYTSILRQGLGPYGQLGVSKNDK